MRIGIPAQDQANDIFGVNTDYLSLVEEAGHTPVILTPISYGEFVETYKIDGLLLPGGADIDSSKYQTSPSFMAQRPNAFLEYFDNAILPRYIRDVPVFGICRGLQLINVYFGGTLKKDLIYHPYSINHTDLVHDFNYTHANGKRYKAKVNSFHHQAVKTLGKDLVALGMSSDNEVEAIAHTKLPIRAVQWHPERIWDEYSFSLMREIFK